MCPLFVAAQVKNEVEYLQVWAGVEAEYQYTPKSLFYFDHQYRHVARQTEGNIKKSGLLSHFEDIRATVGYERLVLKETYLGLSQRVSFEEEEVKWYSRFWLGHEKDFEKSEIESRILFEHIRAKDTSAEAEKIEPENRIRGNTGYNRKLNFFKKEIEIGAELEAMFELNAPEQGQSVRFIDRTRFEVMASYPVSKRWEITLFAISQTKYRYQKPETEPGNRLQEKIKTNTFTPIVGLELEFTGGRLSPDFPDMDPGN